MTMDTWRATGSDGRLDEFCTPELARAVSEWAKAELEECGYPAWDGDRPPWTGRATCAASARTMCTAASGRGASQILSIAEVLLFTSSSSSRKAAG